MNQEGLKLQLLELLKVSGLWTLVRGEDFFRDDRLLASIAMALARLGTSFELVRDILGGLKARKTLGGV